MMMRERKNQMKSDWIMSFYNEREEKMIERVRSGVGVRHADKRAWETSKLARVRERPMS